MADDNESERPNVGLRVAAIILVLGLCAILVCATLPIKPVRSRQGALLHTLRTIAENVNAYRNEHGALPQSLEEVAVSKGPYHEGYRLVVATNGAFLVVADHLSIDDVRAGTRCHFACDEKLQIQKLPASLDSEEKK